MPCPTDPCEHWGQLLRVIAAKDTLEERVAVQAARIVELDAALSKSMQEAEYFAEMYGKTQRTGD